MLLDQKNLAVELLNVFKFSRAHAVVQERPRVFHALSLRLAGSGHFEYEGRSFEISQGQLAYIPAGRDYQVSTEYEEIMVLHFNLWNYGGNQIEVFCPRDGRVSQMLMNRILEEWERPRPGSNYRCTALFYELLAQLQDQSEMAGSRWEALKKIRPSVECLQKRFFDPELTVEELAACSSVSSVYFRRLFHEVFGTAPQTYLTGLRIKRAQELLASGYYSVGETAEYSGFSDAKYFSTVFRKMTGMSPRQYIRSLQ